MAMPRLPQLPQTPQNALRGNGGSLKKSHAGFRSTATTATNRRFWMCGTRGICHNCHALKLVATNVSERVRTILVRSAEGSIDAALQHGGDQAKLVSAHWGACAVC